RPGRGAGRVRRAGLRRTGHLHGREPLLRGHGARGPGTDPRHRLTRRRSGERDLMDASPHSSGLHHLELWTADLAVAEPAWDWLLISLGWVRERVEGWELGRVWRHPDGSYVVLEQSADVLGTRAERRSPGMNH